MASHTLEYTTTASGMYSNSPDFSYTDINYNSVSLNTDKSLAISVHSYTPPQLDPQIEEHPFFEHKAYIAERLDNFYARMNTSHIHVTSNCGSFCFSCGPNTHTSHTHAQPTHSDYIILDQLGESGQYGTAYSCQRMDTDDETLYCVKIISKLRFQDYGEESFNRWVEVCVRICNTTSE